MTDNTTTTTTTRALVLQSHPNSAPIELGVPLCPPAPLPANEKTIMTVGVPGARRVGFEALRAIPVPKPGLRELKDGSTHVSHQPVAFADVADTFRSVRRPAATST